MSWNNGRERKLFERQQAEFRKQYLSAGMTEEQIRAMYELDLAEFNGRRHEALHTQRLNMNAFDEDDSDDGQNPLLEKFIESLTVEIDRDDVNRYAWIDEISDERILKNIKKLSLSEIELLTKIVVDGFNLTEIARLEDISQQAVSKRLKKIKNIFRNRL